MRIYLAGRYSRRLELCGYREQLRALGHVVDAVWLNGEHQVDDAGEPIGEHGESLVEGLRPHQKDMSERAAAPLTHIERDEKRALAMTELVMRFEALTDEALALKARMAILERDYAGPEPRQKAKR